MLDNESKIVPEHAQMKHYVYMLCYPDDSAFYIGKGTHPNRIHAHEGEARTGKTRNPHKVNIIRKMSGTRSPEGDGLVVQSERLPASSPVQTQV